MQWQRLLSSAAAIVGAAAVGCESAPSLHAADNGVPPTAQVQAAGARMQKADGDAKAITPTSHETAAKPARPGRVVATVRALVNGVPIFDSEVMEAAGSQLASIQPRDEGEFQAEIKKIKAAVLEQLIEREVLVQEAKHKLGMANKSDVLKKVEQEADDQLMQRIKKIRAGFKSDEEFNAYLKAHGTSMEEQKRINRRVVLAQQYMQSNIMRPVDHRCGHQEVLDYYKAHPEEFQRIDSVKWQDIFIDASQYSTRQAAYQRAEELVTQARMLDTDGFTKLCEKYDNGLAKTKKGAGLGTHREDITPAEAAPILFEMQDGDIGPIVTVPAGFHVIRLEKRTHAGLAPFNEETQKAIKDKLRNEAYGLEAKHFVDELMKGAHIERFPVGP
jgi:peptidyl-prolyl cis-trans isomerase SurA